MSSHKKEIQVMRLLKILMKMTMKKIRKGNRKMKKTPASLYPKLSFKINLIHNNKRNLKL
jgi:hypothetical protein